MGRSFNTIYEYISGSKSSQKYRNPSMSYSNHHYHPPLNSFNSHTFANRDGHAHGGGGGGGGGWGQGQSQSSPAISALALLGFLFFLNLIQNSLLLNRQLMTTQVVTTGTSTSNSTATAAAAAAAGAEASAGVGTVIDASGGTGITGRVRRSHRYHKEDNGYYSAFKKFQQYFFPHIKRRMRTPGLVVNPSVKKTDWPIGPFDSHQEKETKKVQFVKTQFPSQVPSSSSKSKNTPNYTALSDQIENPIAIGKS